MEEIVGLIGGVLASASMLPQFFKLLKKKDSRDISIVMLVVLIIGVGFWTWYGILKNDWIIIGTNGFSVLLNLLNLVFVIKFKHRSAGQ